MLSLILHTRTVYTSTQLMRATDIGHTASVNLLLDAGAKVNVKNKKVSDFWPSVRRPLDAHQPSAAHLAHGPMVVIRKALPGHRLPLQVTTAPTPRSTSGQDGTGSHKERPGPSSGCS